MFHNVKSRKTGAVQSAPVIAILFILILALSACNGQASDDPVSAGTPHPLPESPHLTYALPSPDTDGGISVEEALSNRRSRRDFQDEALTPAQVSQVLWAAYGITSDGGLRTAPSAGALYPLEVYIIVGNVEGMEPGAYRYIPDEHKIEMVVEGDIREPLSEAALGQGMIREAPASVFYSAVFERTTGRYGQRGANYVYIETGHSAQNVYLQAESLGLGACAVGALTDGRIRELLCLPDEEEPLYLVPFGYVK